MSFLVIDKEFVNTIFTDEEVDIGMIEFKTKEEAEYRATACAWLGETVELKRPGSTFKAKYGADDLVPLAKEWQAKKFAAGYAGITLPRNYGGQGGTQ